MMPRGVPISSEVVFIGICPKQPEGIVDRNQPLGAPHLLDVEEAARWCHISVGTLNHLRAHGRFAPAVRMGKLRFWMAEDLNAWIHAQREPA